MNVQKAIPANVNYRGFPKTICTSVNHVVCHGIPNDKRLKNGDIVNIDVTVIKDGFHGDTSRMYYVGKVAAACAAAQRDLPRGDVARHRSGAPGRAARATSGTRSSSSSKRENFPSCASTAGTASAASITKIRRCCTTASPAPGIELKAGMTFTIEPMVNAGKRHVRLLPDGWTVITKDHSLSAQWEHTVLVTEDGYEVLTLGRGATLDADGRRSRTAGRISAVTRRARRRGHFSLACPCCSLKRRARPSRIASC